MASETVDRFTRRRMIALVGRAALAGAGLSVGSWTRAMAAPQGLPALRSELAAQVAGHRGEAALAVTDLQTDETIEVNGDRPQIAGCTANLFLLYAAVEDLAKGVYTVSHVDWVIRAAVGASDVRWARHLAIEVGRGSLARGVDRVAELMRRIGVRGSVYDHAPGYWSEYSRANQETVVTARDLNAALAKLYRRQLFDARWTDYALAKLMDVRPRLNNMIPALLPTSGVRVAHKVGFINILDYATRNDAGLVLLDRPGGQRAYAFTYLSQHNQSYASSAPFAARLSRLVFDHFARVY